MNDCCFLLKINATVLATVGSLVPSRCFQPGEVLVGAFSVIVKTLRTFVSSSNHYPSVLFILLRLAELQHNTLE